jgi:hypothetical protein
VRVPISLPDCCFSRCWTVDYDLYTIHIQNAAANGNDDVLEVVDDLKRAVEDGLAATVGGDLVKLSQLASDLLDSWHHQQASQGSDSLGRVLALSDLLTRMETGWKTCGSKGTLVLNQVLSQPFAAAFAAFEDPDLTLPADVNLGSMREYSVSKANLGVIAQAKTLLSRGHARGNIISPHPGLFCIVSRRVPMYRRIMHFL